MSYGYDKDNVSALDAITEAQRIAFAPMLFQAAINLRNHGILAFLDKCGNKGANLDDIVNITSLSPYAVELLLDVGLSGRIVIRQDDNYFLTKVGHYLHHDRMTRINMDFTQDVCYQGMFYLDEALSKNKPAGLKVFGEWPTIYPALSQLPPQVKESWFAFDHFYSDAAFDAALPYVFQRKVQHLYDVGGNTGKWAMRCYDHDSDVQITIIDLPEQIALALENIEDKGKSDRIHAVAVDLLSDSPLPCDADIWWMSQFLDCFSETQIVAILRKIALSMKADARVCILEIFWDCQKWEAGAFSLNASSLYFTCLANGTSRFYAAKRFLPLLNEAGLIVEQQVDHLGIGHTLLICKKQ
ncbi:SAM-dependent methyltransferase [Brenneria goodwinii]|uniref:Biotin synthesis protein BioC n=1 Tax=Brenneria goodwinii TaxID=1109412 RepID=A0A0G4JT70_9GAMM|nr:class I SAM-dependent methyltransferase [Brenneria goodwinii]MCG8157381.1 SAM-dependent methyltransferase [Brenneria goodwinii]MCG8163178.1 SAM-dependent methyltransferase [Brenneria goodwinii]MCG8165195.1 SAM-dependent methyltransferase [Brenneria goodwinii]MCG8170837.1 SAM-dependent methyltransferase [Brenneria goodwinii]MCG8175962.1 SAM-dependent methyltransferase [Brenneria goodwinii]